MRNARLQSGGTYLVRREEKIHVVSEDYGYKTGSYYTILSREIAGEPVAPDSRSVLDAAVVPVCLERAARAGIPVADCVISQSCTPDLPAILYGLNYFSCTSEFSVVRSREAEKEVVRHLTNNGKYPYCCQSLSETAEVIPVIAIFGKITGGEPGVRDIAERLYAEFRIPLMTLVLIREGVSRFLSSITPTRYSSLSPAERSLLQAYLANQEFL
jgi:hypothetical protein